MMATKASKPRAVETRKRAAELRRREQVRERRRSLLRRGLLGIVLVAVVGALFASVLSGGGRGGGDLPGVQTYAETSNHVQGPVHYPQTPPAGGNHNPTWLNCGIYASPVPNENAVHNLEHGAVWITYRPDLPAANVQRLRTIVGSQTYVDLSPYPGLPAPVVASAWGKQLRLQSADDPQLSQFIRKYRLGPQNPEPGAPCTGGIGTPITP